MAKSAFGNMNCRWLFRSLVLDMGYDIVVPGLYEFTLSGLSVSHMTRSEELSESLYTYGYGLPKAFSVIQIVDGCSDL